MSYQTLFRCAFCTLLTFIFVSHLKSQHLVNATGNTIKDSAYYVEYSVGEIAISTFANDKHHLTQGLLQPNLKEFAAQADIFIVKRNVFFFCLRDIGRLPYRHLRSGNYNLVCTVSSFMRTNF